MRGIRGIPGTLGTGALRPVALAVAIALVLIAFHSVEWNAGMAGGACIACGLLLWRRSVLAAVHLLGLAIAFGVAPQLAAPHQVESLAFGLVVLWALGISLGACLASSARPARGTHLLDEGYSIRPHLIIGWSSIILQLLALRGGHLGMEAQLNSGVTSPIGVMGYAAAVGPVITQMIVLYSFSHGRGRGAPLVLAAFQVVILALTGFRGAGVLYIVGAVIALRVWNGRDTSVGWRHSLPAVVVACVLAVGAFMLASEKKSDAIEASVGSDSTFGLSSDPLTNVLARLDKSAFLDQAVRAAELPWVREALSWNVQVAVGVPRLVWPNKPIGDYGQRVSVYVYGFEPGQTSSTVTVVGDAYINLGRPGVLLGGVALGFLLAGVESWVRRSDGVVALALTPVIVSTALNFETPLGLMVVTSVRLTALSCVVWWCASIGARRNSSTAVARSRTIEHLQTQPAEPLPSKQLRMGRERR